MVEMKATAPLAGARVWLLAGAAVAAVTTSLLMPAPALAQSAPAQTADDEELDSIVVTGSRIRRAGFDTLEPASVVSSEYLETRGITNVADALNEIPGFGVGVTPEGGQSSFGVGQNFVNRFGLGTNRTLTLVNGRRFVTSNAASIFGPAAAGVQVDLNVIPTIMVERTENVAIGGAPTYGSDAISGVVNVITKRRYEGVELRALSGVTSRGDNFRFNVSALAGQNFDEDRGNIMIAVSHDWSDGVLQTQRPRFARSLGFFTNPLASEIAALQPGRTAANDGRINPAIGFNTGGADGIPNSVLIDNRRLKVLTFGGLLFPATGAFNIASSGGLLRGFGTGQNVFLQFAPGGNIVPYNQGSSFGNNDSSGGDGLNLVETAPLLNDLRRTTVNLNAGYDLRPNIRAFIETTYYYAESLEIIDQPIYQSNLFGGLSQPVTFRNDDPRLNAQARAQLAANNITSFRLTRASRDLVNNNASGTQEIWRGVAGLEGSFEWADRSFNWEVTAVYGRNKGIYTQTVLNQQRFVNAMNVTTDAQGNIICRGAAQPGLVLPGGGVPVVDPACRPISLFGEGATSAEGRAYVTDVTRAVAINEQTVFNANIGGDLFDMWAGPIQFNVGVEHRKEEASFEPNEFQRLGLGRAVPIAGNAGAFNTDEVFGEVLIPLASPDNEWPLLYKLDVTGKARYVDNTVNGGFLSWTGGAQWRPIEDIEFRGNYTRSLRAPAITELFTPRSELFSTVADPCDSRNVAAGLKPAVRARNCAAFYQAFNIANGASTFQSNAVTATVRGVTGGDPNLENEVAKSWTIGAVIQPRFIPRLRVAVDWYDIQISGPILSLTANQIANGCFDNDEFNTADVANANSFCSRITRLANGQINPDGGFRAGFVNGAAVDFSGLSAEANYSFELADLGLGDIGQVDLQGSFYYLKTLVFNETGIVPNINDGEIGNSTYQGQLQVGYTNKGFALDLVANYTSSALFDRDFTPETRDILEVGSNWRFDMTVGYNISERMLMRLAITNLFDTDPPFPLAGAALGAYDALGRRFAVSAQIKF